MNTEKWETYHLETLYTLAEDIYRFAPWESDISPFMLIDPEHPDAYVLVVMEDDGEGVHDIRLVLGAEGLRAWLTEESDETDALSVEDYVNRYEGYYLEVGYNMPNLNNVEKRLLNERQPAITFRRQRPGYGLATIVDSRDYDHLQRYLRAILQLLTRQALTPLFTQSYGIHKNGNKQIFTAASFQLLPDGPTASPLFSLSLDQWLKPLPAVIDEFSNARVKHLPSDGRTMELFYFYLPMAPDEKGALARAYFLVDLDSGFIEWNDIFIGTNDWRERLLRRLWRFFIESSYRPALVLMQNINSYTALTADLSRAGITSEYIRHSYVGQELFDSYLEAAHLKHHQLLNHHLPKDPY